MFDLEAGERVHLNPEPIVSLINSASEAAEAKASAKLPEGTVIGADGELKSPAQAATPPASRPVGGGAGEDSVGEDELVEMAFEGVRPDEPCQVQIRQLGEYLARLTIKGGHRIPLKVEVLKR